MPVYLENTLTGDRMRVDPGTDERIDMYYCGLTTSDPAHLGHARSWVHVDVLRRWLEHRGVQVRHVENFTDVNEKIVARVGERPTWTDEAAVADHFIERTLADMRSLNLKRAHAYPRVSEHIDEIIAMIERLIDSGHAYEADGSVYFDVSSFSTYGELSNQDPAELEASDDAHPAKRHPADFALWKAGGVSEADIADHAKDPDLDLAQAVDGASTWSSPWGQGRPGWHIECSAMSTTHLGETFDIHVAGRDIIFPHNENEIAQAEAATNGPYARCWVHVDLLETNGEKMSSSLENFFTVESAVDEYGPDVVRTFLLSASHDTRQTFSEEAIEEATARWRRLRTAYEDAIAAADSPDATVSIAHDDLRASIHTARTSASDALDDNLDTRGALTAVGSLARELTTYIDEGPPYDYGALVEAIDLFESIGGAVLGLSLSGEATSRHDLDDVLDAVVTYREAMREAGNYEAADALRAHLREHGIEIEDTDSGPKIRFR